MQSLEGDLNGMHYFFHFSILYNGRINTCGNILVPRPISLKSEILFILEKCSSVYFSLTTFSHTKLSRRDSCLNTYPVPLCLSDKATKGFSGWDQKTEACVTADVTHRELFLSKGLSTENRPHDHKLRKF